MGLLENQILEVNMESFSQLQFETYRPCILKAVRSETQLY